MYAVTKGELTIREMKTEDVMSLVKTAQIPAHMVNVMVRELKQQIRDKKEESDMLFAILYKNKVVGKIDIIFTEQYKKDPKYKGMKTDGNMLIEIPDYDICMKIADEVSDMFVGYCKEEGFVDVLGIPKVAPTGIMYWEPMVILQSA